MSEPDLSDAPRLREFFDLLPASTSDVAEAMDVAPTTVEGYRDRLTENHGVTLEYDRDANLWSVADDGDEATSDDSETPTPPDLSDVDTGEDPSPEDLTGREEYILHKLQTGATLEELTDDLDERDTIVTQHLRDLKREGWKIYFDERAEHVAIEGDHTLRSSEHKGTRTRKANRWWESTHNELVREWKKLDPPSPPSEPAGTEEDWVTHLTDLHAGDKVRGYDDQIVHRTEDLVDIIDYITEQSLALADKHNAEYGTAYLLWGGDAVTNEAIYEGQFENLDAWLDEQVDILHDPLLRQIRAFGDRFETVRIVAQPGNHGDIRASGSSKQANADLILYKNLRNTVGALREFGECENVDFKIGRAGSPTPFRLRDGQLHGQLRHGQDRKPQAETSARLKEWFSTLLDSENFGDKFDICWMGHHHVSGRLPWNGPPVIISGSPKPSGEYPRKLGVVEGPGATDMATVHGVSDDGITSIWPIDARNYDR